MGDCEGKISANSETVPAQTVTGHPDPPESDRVHHDDHPYASDSTSTDPQPPVSSVAEGSGGATCPVPPAPTLVVLMARKSTPELLARVERLLAVGLDVHLIVDCPIAVDERGGSGGEVRVHFIDDADLLAVGFTDLQSKTCGKKLTAWERALLWCARKSRAAFAYAWLVEDDVLWDTASTLASLVRGYDNNDADLVTQDIAGSQASRPSWPHWNAAYGLIPREAWAASFNVICRVSRRLLSAVATLGRSRGCLCFHEVLLRSLAVQYRLRVALFHDPHESLASLPPPLGFPRMLLRYRPAFTDLDLRRALERCGRGTSGGSDELGIIFHPVKHFSHELDL